MKVKTPGPFVGMDTENALRTERFTSFYNDDQENTSPHPSKPVERHDAKFARYSDKNTPEDLAKHSNSIQAHDRVAVPSFDRSTKPVAVPVKAAAPVRSTPQSALTVSTTPLNPSNPKAAISTMYYGPCKPLWQHTMTNAEQISALGLTSQEIQKQETIFELIYTESEYLDDLKSIHKIFVEELNVKMAEARRKKRFSIDKADVKLYERLARLLSHIKDLWNGHQSLLRSLQNKQQQATPIVEDIGSVFESFYMFSIYDSYFAQYTTTSRDFQHIAIGNSELCLIIKDLLKSPRCKCLTLEGIFLKPIQRLQKYPLFFKDLMNLTPNTDPDYVQLEHALNNHQRELTKIDDRIWIEEHNEMLTDLQQRIKGLPSNFSLVERHRYLILDGPVHRITVRQPSKFGFGKHNSKSESYISNGSLEWRDGFRSPIASLTPDDDPPTLIHRPSQLDYHHLHAKPAFPSTPPPSSASSASSSHSALTSPSLQFPFTQASRTKNAIDTRYDGPQQTGFYHTSPSSPPSTTTLHSLSSVPSPIPIPNSDSPSSKQQPTVSQLVSQYNFNMSSSFSSLTGAGHPRNISSSALYLPGIIKNSTDVEAEYHVFIFTDIVLWTKRVMSRYHRKEGIPWNFKLVEPVSRLTSVCNTSEDNIFMCTSVNTSSASYLVRTEDGIAARMWRTTVPTLIPFHCSRNMRDRRKK
ncbi:Dbl homology domain-containing protein [Dissophora ornata]|nr:Dbl homology domain-containing protein [Dissophora ornata]